MSTAEALARSGHVLFVAGAGGAGKTTLAAAFALLGARLGRRVAVVTVDPAKRLGDALGLDRLGGSLEPVVLGPEVGAPRGALYAMMLDQRAGWDRLVRAHAPPPIQAALLASPFYARLSEELAGAHVYAALDTILALASDAAWDLVVVDTPPFADALELLRAPARARALLQGDLARGGARLLRGVLGGAPGAGGHAAAWAHALLERAVGARALGEVAALLAALAALAPALEARAAAAQALLCGARTTAVLVATADGRSVRGASEFLAGAPSVGLRASLLVLNRAALPALAEGPLDRAAVVAELEPVLGPDLTGAVLRAYARAERRGARERRLIAELRRRHPALEVVTVPELERAACDLVALAALATALARG